jgi:leader peptidase (prepilin peptidase)/N-methyltransferase
MPSSARARECGAPLPLVYAPPTVLLSDLPPAWFLGFAFVLGATWGSFFNVAIYRWPRGMSVITPPSHCPACGAPVPWYRNVPILAYVSQRGRAACCGAPLTPRYLVVEVLSGVLLLAVAHRILDQAPRGTELAEAGLVLGTWFVFVGGLLIATFVDLEHMEIPDEVTIGGTALGLATMSLRTVPLGQPSDPAAPLELALGAGAGYLVVMLFFVHGWERWAGRRGMGEGDAMLMLFIGTFLGWRGALFALFAGAVQGTLAVLVGQLVGRPVTEPIAKDGPEDLRPSTPATAASADAADAPARPLTSAEAARGEGGAEPPAPASSAGEEPDDGSRPGIRFGPFLALAALEFQFFGAALIDLYADWIGR